MGAQSALAKGIVHLSFPGGGMFLPARTPYDRQTVVEHVKDRARVKGEVQVSLDNCRWVVRWSGDPAGAICVTCGQPSESSCRRSANSGIHCVTCAFGDPEMHTTPNAA